MLLGLAVSAAKTVGAVIPTVNAQTGWSPTAIGVWVGILVQLLVLGGVIVRYGPGWVTAWQAGKKQDAEIEAAGKKVIADEAKAIAERMAALERQVSNLGNAMTYVANASACFANALEAKDPNNAALHQGRELIAMAAAVMGDSDPYARALSRLANIPATVVKTTPLTPGDAL